MYGGLAYTGLPVLVYTGVGIFMLVAGAITKWRNR
jgi:hypothetical protein